MVASYISLMKRPSVKRSVPPGIAEGFVSPPLLSDESQEEYDRVFQAIAFAVQPADGMAWLFVRDIADLTWDIRRERRLKSWLLRSAEVDIVELRLQPDEEPRWPGAPEPPQPSAKQVKESRKTAMKLRKKADTWISNPDARGKLSREIERNGYDSSDIPVSAFRRSAGAIDAIDRRIAGYEARRMMTLKMIEFYDEALARRVARASRDVIEGEYAEVAAE